jgi:uncharacterized protein
MQFDSLKAYVFEQLEKNLATTLYYHGAHHTLYVYNAAMKIAEHENVTGKDLTILMTAVLLHDYGFLETYNQHEEKGCEMAKKILPGYGYSTEQIDMVCSMIMRTKIPQIAFNKLEEIICDADLDYLGTDDFLPIGNQLFKEFLHYGVVKDEEGWNRLQMKFLVAHQYFTGYAKKFREEKKQQNLKLISDIVQKYDINTQL